MRPEVAKLVTALGQTRTLLRQHGDKWLSARLDELERRLARGDWTAIEGAITEATGSMGSLRDRWLSAANGDAITREQEPVVNAHLDFLVQEVERHAREAAAAVGVHLSW